MAGPLLHALFQQAHRVAKRVRTAGCVLSYPSRQRVTKGLA